MPTGSLDQVDAAEGNAQFTAQNTAGATTGPIQIDAAGIIRDFSRARKVQPSSSFGLECAVDWVPPEERFPISIAACPVCRGREAEPRFQLRDFDYKLVTCTVCGLGRLNPLPDPQTIANFYPPEYYGVTGAKFVPAIESLIRIVGARQARALTRGLAARSRVLDIGCGRGVLLKTLADMGFDTHGFEISENAAAGADTRAQIRIAPSLAQAGYRGRYFDSVILWHVLEHLPDPRETLLEIRRIMRRGARLAVSVPNFSSAQARWAGPAWFHLDLPRHLYHFPRTALKRLMTECGFECVTEHHFSLRQNPFGWVQSALNKFPQIPRNGLYTLLKRGQSANGHCNASLNQWMKVAYAAGMPMALAASIAETLFRSGASISISAIAR
ncbi:MAG: class I SAM-dependent methyltransferase [Planctomycetaceae bacterium]